MIFDLDGQEEGTWFRFFGSSITEKGEIVYDDPLPDAGRVCIRSIGPIIEQIQGRKKKKHEFVLNPQTRSMERVGYFDDIPPEQNKAESDEVWDYAITGIEDFFDRNGKPILATKENKSRLMDKPIFSRFVSRCLQILSSTGIQAKEELGKNSVAGLSGLTSSPTDAQPVEQSTEKEHRRKIHPVANAG